MVYIGIDVGGTGVQVGVVDKHGHILAKDSFPTGVGRPYQEMIRDMADCTRSAVAKAGLSVEDIQSIGVGIPGLADAKTGNVIFCTNLGWRDIPLRDEFQRHLDTPVYIDNDAAIVYIIQGKFYSGERVNAEPLREVLASWVQIKNLKQLQENANEKLKVKINELATALEDDYEVCFELITTSELTDAAKDDLAVFQKELSDDNSLSANLVLVDNEVLKFKYDEALNKNRPYINHEFQIEPSKCMEIMVGGTKAVIAALPLKECIKIPGIKDGSLFRKNVRQSLGTTNKVNKGIAMTLKKDAKDFFFFHNGITAICSKLTLDEGLLSVKELNVVNGCQSLSTIYSCSENVRNSDDG